jgi:hypothetical protein
VDRENQDHLRWIKSAFFAQRGILSGRGFQFWRHLSGSAACSTPNAPISDSKSSCLTATLILQQSEPCY